MWIFKVTFFFFVENIANFDYFEVEEKNGKNGISSCTALVPATYMRRNLILVIAGVLYCTIAITIFYSSTAEVSHHLVGEKEVVRRKVEGEIEREGKGTSLHRREEYSSTTETTSPSTTTTTTTPIPLRNVPYSFSFKDKTLQYTYVHLPKINCSSSTILLSVVLSDPSGKQIRKTIRETWANANQSIGVKSEDVRVLFIIGYVPNIQLMNEVFKEANEHNDIIVTSANDTYPNLVIKSLTLMHFHSHYCPARFLLKVDQDVVFHFDRFLHHFSTGVFKEKEEEVYGKTWDRTRPIRNQTHRWYISDKQYRGKYYPRFCSGPAYIFNRKAVNRILSNLKDSMIIYVEDVFITGILSERSEVNRVNINKFVYSSIYGSMFSRRIHCDLSHTPYMMSIHGWKTTKSIKEGWDKLNSIKCTGVAKWW